MIHARAEFQELANLHNANGRSIQTTKKDGSRSVKEILKGQSIFFYFHASRHPLRWFYQEISAARSGLEKYLPSTTSYSGVFLKRPKMGVRKYIFLSSQLNAVQKSQALKFFHKLLYLGIIVVCSCVSWFLRIELGNMCNSRLSPSENLGPLTKPGSDCSDRIGLRIGSDSGSDRIGLAIRLKFRVKLKVIPCWLLYDCEGLDQSRCRRENVLLIKIIYVTFEEVVCLLATSRRYRTFNRRQNC